MFSITVTTAAVETTWLGGGLFDWIEVLAVPVVISILSGFFLVVAQRAGARADEQTELASEQARTATLRTYLDRISDLILENGLTNSVEGDPARAVAHARTYAVLRSLDGPRKGILIQFLRESSLITGNNPVISLALADLTDATLSGIDLRGCDFSGANLRDAYFYESDLRGAKFEDAVITNRQLSEASDLVGAMLQDGSHVTEETWSELRNTGEL